MTMSARAGGRNNSGLMWVALLLAFWAFGLAAAGCSSSSTPSDGDTSDGDASDGDLTDGDTDGDTTDGDIDDDIPDGDIPDGDKPDGDTDGDTADGDTDDDTTDGDLDPDPDAEKEPGELAVSPDPIDVGLVDLLAENSVSVTIENSAAPGGERFTVGGVELTLSSDAALDLDNCLPPFRLDPGESTTCDVVCAPTQPGAHDGVLRVYGTSENGDPTEVRVEILCDTVLPMGYADPAMLEFGYVDPVLAPRTRFVTIGNAGSADLEIFNVALSADSDAAFSLLTDPGEWDGLVLAPGAGFLVELRYTPVPDSQVLGWLEIDTNDPQMERRLVALSGRGLAVCPEGTTLSGDTCVSVCLPKSSVCASQNRAMRVCSDAGDALGAAIACAQGQTCLEGRCLWSLCTPDVALCHDGAPGVCDASATPVASEPACSDGTDCPSVCLPDSGCGFPENNHYCEDGNPCTDDVCTTGAGCGNPYNNDPCMDENACTEGERCVQGACTGLPISCNDNNPCTVDSCDPVEGCVSEATEGSCNDSDACTVNDRCQNGECQGDPRTCEDGNDCTTDSCDPAFGCQFISSGLACDDSNPCTIQDSCTNSSCQGILLNPDDGQFCNGPEVCDPNRPADDAILSPAPVICTDNLSCTIDTCNESQDRCDHTPDHQRCNDNNPCTADLCDPQKGCTHTAVANQTSCDILPGVLELCFSGQCVTRCTVDADCQDGLGCTVDVCDVNVMPGFGWCRHNPVNALCDNDLWCDGAESCDLQLGCVAGEAVDCSDALLCTQDICNEEADRCDHSPRHFMCDDYNPCTVNVCESSIGCAYMPSTGTCDDSNPCTLFDYCNEGQCQPGQTALQCDDSNACTTDFCEPGRGCETAFNQIACDDGDPCTGPDACESGVCFGQARDCDDGVFCNGVEPCDGLGCGTGEPVHCDDGVDCTVEACDENERACVSTPDDSLCADDNPCTTNEICTFSGCEAEILDDDTVCKQEDGGDWTCQDGACVAPCESAEDCDDNIACTIESCDEESGYCRHTPESAYCNDSQWCNGTETCDRFKGCIAGEGLDCSDSVACTVDSCDDTELSCFHDPDNSRCDDLNVCTVDICSSETGCSHAPIPGDCDDSNICTVNDSCSGGRCVGTPKDCDDLNPCTVDSCNPSVGCKHTQAQDGLACGSGIVDRVCINGRCESGCTSDTSCNDDLVCTVDTCNPNTHQCDHLTLDALCDNGLFCDGKEVCKAESGCEPGLALDCDDDDPCTLNVCNEQRDRCENPEDTSVCDDENSCTRDICTAESCQWENTSDACDDGNICTVGDVCSGGACTGQPRSCSDGNACTTDTCDPFFGCLYSEVVCPQAGACKLSICDPASGCQLYDRFVTCDDGDPCTEGDRCDSGSCEAGISVDCDDNNSCTADSCGPDGCEHARLSDGSSCALFNQEQGRCVAGQCTRVCTNNAKCIDGASCSTGVCTDGLVPGVKVCQYTLDHAVCDDGLFCNGEESCQPFLGCIAGAPVDCSDGIDCTEDSCDEEQDLCMNAGVDLRCADNNACTAERCDPSEGCIVTTLSATPCDDANPCTVADTCQDGVCEGAARDCNDGNPCTGPDTCDVRKGCRNPPVQDNLACGEDGLCLNGACAESCHQDSDCDDGVACTLNICDAITGHCRFLADDGACSDGLYCNGSEWCHPQFDCQPGARVNCDDGITCTVDSCSDSLRRCLHEGKDNLCAEGNSCTRNTCNPARGCVLENLDGQSCDDGNSCTAGEVCQGGFCGSGEPVDCEGSECVLSQCDPRVGCLTLNREGDVCIANACSFFSRCAGGECVITNPRDCADTNPCTEDSCDAVGGCQYQPRNGLSCNDGNLCTVQDTCNNTVCQGQARNCDDNNSCTADDCDPALGCTHEAANEDAACTDPQGQPGVCKSGLCATACAGSPCSDNNACTATDACVGGQCIGAPISCNDSNPCTQDSCDAASGCVNDALPDNTICAGAGFTGLCQTGLCKPKCSVAQDCDDGNACTADSCTPGGCVYSNLADGNACNDGDACTVGDRCTAGRCTATERVSCGDGNACTVAFCDPQGACDFEAAPDGQSCDDANACTEDDQCSDGLCSGAVIDCDDGNACTAEYCADGQCRSQKLTGVECDDGNPCTLSSVCMQGLCRGTATESCLDDNPCTYDSCTSSGCLHTPVSGRSCDDGDPCTLGDVCREGVCDAGATPQDCDDGNPCTSEQCAPGEGCASQLVENGSACDLRPDTPEVCQDGQCVEFCATDEDCQDSVSCTTDTCDLENGLCEHTPDDAACDDGSAANGSETCDAIAGCLPGVPPVCNDGVFCTDDSVDSQGCVYWPQHYLCNDEDDCTLDRCAPDDENAQDGCIHEPICSR
jgi:hypothetical protein